MNNGTLMNTDDLPAGTSHKAEVIRRLCSMTGIDLVEMQRCLLRYEAQCGELRSQCREMEKRYKTVEDLLRAANCPTNVLFSQVTVADMSADNQVRLENIIKGLGGDYVDTFPVPPGKMIRLEHATRPGYQPRVISMDMNIANNGNNYLDFDIGFYILPGGQPGGKLFGPRYRGNQFREKDGTALKQKFPLYQNQQLVVGSLERFAVEFKNGGPNNLESVHVVFYHDANCAFDACK